MRYRLCLLLLCAILLPAFAHGGYKAKLGMGVPLQNPGDTNAINAAITSIEKIANSPGQNAEIKATLLAVANCLRGSLKNKKICRESNPKSNWDGITLVDGKASWKGDAINLKPSVLANPGLLVGLLVHEGIHAIQSAPSSAQREWAAYGWGAFALEQYLKTVGGLTAAQKRAVKKDIAFQKKMQQQFCAAYLASLEREKKKKKASTAEAKQSAASPTTRYTAAVTIANQVDIVDTVTFNDLGTLASTFDLITSLEVVNSVTGDVLFVFGTDLAGLAGGVEVFTDNTGDGIADQATAQLLLPPGALTLPLSTDLGPGGDQILVLDSRPNGIADIKVLIDTGIDSVPDALAAVDFANGDLFPELMETESIFVEASGSVLCTSLSKGTLVENLTDLMHTLVDTSANGEADVSIPEITAETVSPNEPVFVNDLQVGDTTAVVFATPGATIEVWATSPTGMPLELLGSVLTLDPLWNQVVPLVRPLAAGEFVKPIDVTHGLDKGEPDQVTLSLPEIFFVSASDATPGQVVTIDGRNFGPTPTVTLSGAPAVVVSASDTVIEFVVPEVEQLPAGNRILEVHNFMLGTSPSFFGIYVYGDCNGNGIADFEDLISGIGTDCNGNDILDECEPDCDGDGIPDDCEAPVFFDDFETDQGWVVQLLGASAGAWERGEPIDDPTWDHDPISDSDLSGQCYITANVPGPSDVDGGATALISPQLDLSFGNVQISYDYFLNLSVADGVDRLVVEISSNDLAGPWAEVARHEHSNAQTWVTHQIVQGDIDAAGAPMTASMRLRFTINDDGPDSTVECGVDALRVLACGPVVSSAFSRGDCNVDGTANIADAVSILSVLFPSGCTPGVDCPEPLCDDSCDANDDGTLNIADAVAMLSVLFPSGCNPGVDCPVFPEPVFCGPDPTPDGLMCASFAPCP